MTLPTSKELERELTAIETDPGLPQHVRDLARTAFNVGRKAQHVATLSSLSPQTGLDFEKAMRDTGNTLPDNYPLIVAALNAQIGVLLAAKEREIEFYRESGKAETAYQLERAERAEARVAALEGVLKNLLSVCNDLDRKVGVPSDHGIYCIEARRVIELRALLDRRDP